MSHRHVTVLADFVGGRIMQILHSSALAALQGPSGKIVPIALVCFMMAKHFLIVLVTPVTFLDVVDQ